MSDAVMNYPHMSREEEYFEALEAFLRTSAGYLDVAQGMPCRDLGGNHATARFLSRR